MKIKLSGEVKNSGIFLIFFIVTTVFMINRWIKAEELLSRFLENNPAEISHIIIKDDKTGKRLVIPATDMRILNYKSENLLYALIYYLDMPRRKERKIDRKHIYTLNIWTKRNEMYKLDMKMDDYGSVNIVFYDGFSPYKFNLERAKIVDDLIYIMSYPVEEK